MEEAEEQLCIRLDERPGAPGVPPDRRLPASPALRLNPATSQRERGRLQGRLKATPLAPLHPPRANMHAKIETVAISLSGPLLIISLAVLDENHESNTEPDDNSKRI